MQAKPRLDPRFEAAAVLSLYPFIMASIKILEANVPSCPLGNVSFGAQRSIDRWNADPRMSRRSRFPVPREHPVWQHVEGLRLHRAGLDRDLHGATSGPRHAANDTLPNGLPARDREA